MSESESPAAASGGGRSNRNGNEPGGGDGRQMLLEEARTTTSQQLAQINKLDGEAVRTVRIAFVLTGLLVGGAKLVPSLGLGLLGAAGTVSLVGSLVASLFVYGTSKLFIGSSPDRIPIDYEEQIDTEAAYVEVIGRYERGLLRNRRVLWSNAFFLDASRFLLACAVVLFVLAAVFHVAIQSTRIQLLYQPLSVITEQF
ncbi:hypothetical protein [Halorussus lipolyticus]|uniref:hypothetical protein n=1 Tax=Halorussus lipolyticus TaxID=3034024 RepID=UPI0023E792E3|nr:hypothetical protein [Halorussus sp. DT80]